MAKPGYSHLSSLVWLQTPSALVLHSVAYPRKEGRIYELEKKKKKERKDAKMFIVIISGKQDVGR